MINTTEQFWLGLEDLMITLIGADETKKIFFFFPSSQINSMVFDTCRSEEDLLRYLPCLLYVDEAPISTYQSGNYWLCKMGGFRFGSD